MEFLFVNTPTLLYTQNNGWIVPLSVDSINYTQVLNHKSLPK